MSLEGIYFISQIVSAWAIVASLILVALLMRQAYRTQRGMFSNPGMRAVWLTVSPGYSDAHVKMVNELLIDGHP